MKCYNLLIILLVSFQVVAAEHEQYNSESVLKTFFTTPAERIELDQYREAGVFRKDFRAQAADKTPVFREPLKVEMKGVVIRENEKPVFWVNEGNTLKSSKIDESVKVRPKKLDSKTTQVPISIYDRTYKMKPGEVWTESDFKVKDKYQIK